MSNPKIVRVIVWDETRPVFADVNHYHPVKDWDAYKKANVPGVIGIKISEGGLVSKGAMEAVRSAESRGLVVIGYNYGTQGVQTFLEAFDPRPGRIPALDYEGNSSTVKNAEVWIRAVTAAYKRRPWFYGHEHWLLDGAPEGTEVSRCPYWGSEYGNRLEIPRGVGEPMAWQYANGVKGPQPHTHAGLDGGCDMSALLISTERLLSQSGIAAVPNKTPKQTPA